VAEVAVEEEASVLVAVEVVEEAVVEEVLAEALSVVVWVPESVSTLDCHKSMRRSLGR